MHVRSCCFSKSWPIAFCRCYCCCRHRRRCLTLRALGVISIKFLLVISVLFKTEWSWELRTWSHKMNLLDILSTSPHYLGGKWIGATNENSNFDFRVQKVKLLRTTQQKVASTHMILAFLEHPWLKIWGSNFNLQFIQWRIKYIVQSLKSPQCKSRVTFFTSKLF